MCCASAACALPGYHVAKHASKRRYAAGCAAVCFPAQHDRDVTSGLATPMLSKTCCMHMQVAKQGGEDEGLETSTASDDSGQGPWTVVTSPTHARTPSDEVTSPRPRHAATEAAPSCAAAELSTSLQAVLPYTVKAAMQQCMFCCALFASVCSQCIMCFALSVCFIGFTLLQAAVEEEPAPQAATDQPAKSAGTNAGAEVTKMRRPVDGQAGTGDEDDDLDISDDDGAVAAAGGAESEVDEDWGSWE